ncbi:MAG: UDP-N-acetylmuramate dehydrogenase [Halieaceae bacterium]
MANSIELAVDLQGFNTLAVPATAAHYVALTDSAALPEIIAEAGSRTWAIRVLGEGSNLVLGEHHPGLTIHQRCRGIEQIGESAGAVTLRVSAGENWHEFVNWCLDQGFYGLENLALIPGTVGAAPVQNIGAYGVEVAPFIDAVHCRDLRSAEAVSLTAVQCQFDYRDSLFKRVGREQQLIEAVDFILPRRAAPVTHYPSLAGLLQERQIDSPTPQQVFDAVVEIRQARLPDPAVVPNAGSFFKNPTLSEEELQAFLASFPEAPHFPDGKGRYRLAAAWMIEACGFKRLDSAVRVHPEHALVIINPERRPATAILELAQEIVTAVRTRFAIELEQEPRCA